MSPPKGGGEEGRMLQKSAPAGGKRALESLGEGEK